MSRIGKQPIDILPKTEVKVSGNTISVKGPLGELTRTIDSSVGVTIADGKVTVTPKRNDNQTKAYWGTVASHVYNMIEGVNKAFEKKLIVEGIGFKADIKGTDIVMGLGFSHPVKIAIPKGLKVTSEKNLIVVSGIDKELVGQFTAMLRSQKKPEPYKGKGIRYEGEVIRRKQGKKTV